MGAWLSVSRVPGSMVERTHTGCVGDTMAQHSCFRGATYMQQSAIAIRKSPGIVRETLMVKSDRR